VPLRIHSEETPLKENTSGVQRSKRTSEVISNVKRPADENLPFERKQKKLKKFETSGDRSGEDLKKENTVETSVSGAFKGCNLWAPLI
jgi:hypothetical protein